MSLETRPVRGDLIEVSKRLVPKSVTLNDLERRNGRCIALFRWIWQTCVL